MKKLLLVAGLVIIFILLLLYVNRNQIAKRLVATEIQKSTGLPAQVGSIKIALFKNRVTVNNLSIQNPDNFSDVPMIHFRELFMFYEFKSFFSGKNHFYQANIHLNQFLLEKNDQGKWNINALRETKAPEKQEPPKAKPEFLIDELNLSIDNIIFKDASQDPEVIKPYQITYKEQFKNVNGISDILSTIATALLKKEVLGKISGISLPEISEEWEDLTEQAQTVKEKTQKTKESVEKSFKEFKKKTENILTPPKKDNS